MKIIRRFNDSDFLPQWHMDPVLTKIFWSRGIKDPNELSYSLKNLNLPKFKDLDIALQLIVNAVWNKQNIMIVGDYDCDGATSTALAMRFFDAIDFTNICYEIPNRNIDGYGINKNIVDKAVSKNISLIITVDNGISAHDAVAYARERNIDIVITDHHLPLEELPNANAIVNPQRKDCEFASKNIAGVGVIFYLLTAVCRTLTEKGYFTARNISVPDMRSFLDLVAIGTIADVVSLDYNNRCMVQYGINLIRNNCTTNGVKELVKRSKCTLNNFTSNTISFALSPKLNAAGRIDEMKHGVECLVANDEYDAKSKAIYLDTLNTRRRELEKNFLTTASNIISNSALEDKASIVVYDKSYIAGIVGIIASKILNKYLVPTVVFAPSNEEGKIVGSARANEEFNIHDIFKYIAEQHAESVYAFGGHRTAAGITIKLDFLPEFTNLFNLLVSATPNYKEKTFITDGELPAPYINPSFARFLNYEQPWGKDFVSPEFDGRFQLIKQFIVNNLHLRLLFRLENGTEVWGMYFNYDAAKWPNLNVNFVRVVYSLDVSANREDANVSFIVRGMEPLS